MCIRDRNRGMYTKAPALLYKDVSMAEKTLRDLYSSEEDLIIVNGKIVYEDISKNNMNVEYYEDKIPMFHNYLIESQIDKLFSKKVWLKSGGYLIIDETEAMTVIDVNSGKAVSQESFAKTNREAAEEVARQIRLRNISGMIIVDFINTNGKNDAQNLSNFLRNYISKDRIKTRIIGMTEPQYDPNRCVSCGACIKGCDKLSVDALKMENYRIVRNEEKCVGCGVCVTKCPTRAWTRSAKKYYRLTLMGRTGKKNPRLGEDFLIWADEDTIIKVILNTYKFVKEYIDPNAPGGKEHVGYIIDRVGFAEYKKWALDGVELPPETIVKDNIYWSGIYYR